MDVHLRGTMMPDRWAAVMRRYGFNDVCCPGDLDEAIASGEDITLYVNSDGGSLVAGTEIYSRIAGYSGQTTAHIQTRAASAATVAIMACSRIVAEPVSLICVHNPSSYAEGDASVMRHTAEELENVKEAILAAYRGRVKKSDEEISALMDRDVWIDARTAAEYGLVDTVLERKKGPAVLVNGTGVLQFPTVEMMDQYDNEIREEAERKNRQIQAAKAFFAMYR